MMRKDPCPLRKRRANCIPIEDESKAATPKSVDERVPRDSSFVLIYRINPENQRLDRRERERERENPTNRAHSTRMKL